MVKRPIINMSVSSPQTPSSTGCDRAAIAYMLNDSFNSHDQVKPVTQSGLPTPDATPVQASIKDASQDLTSLDSNTSDPIDPAVIPAITATTEEHAPLFTVSRNVTVASP